MAINLLQSRTPVPVDSVNYSKGGLCLRLQEALEVRSVVHLQVVPGGSGQGRSQRQVECTGRVAWVIQRLDLRTTPPFLYDVGVEFVDPPPMLRQLIARGESLTSLRGQATSQKFLEPAVIHGRPFMPRLARVENHPMRWHLVVSIDGAPCFSGHYPSERAALAAWAKFRRQQTKR